MQDTIVNELVGSFRAVPPEVALVRVVAAMVLAGLVGAEREWRHRPAGLRTHILVSLAACLYVIVGRELVAIDWVVGISTAPGEAGQLRFDPLRLIEAVTAGVAFLVAGIIITSGGRVRNVTTGASLWLAGAIGLACGGGLIPLAALAAAVVLTVLVILAAFRRRDAPD